MRGLNSGRYAGLGCILEGVKKKGRRFFLISFSIRLYFIRKGASVSVIVLLLIKYWGSPKLAVDISHL